ncbi:hypothetical protein [Flexivirga caeni]|uniref:Uncharacterized protein n=1 Tax=Flexivirga caeni TaxID=2294115 RepID=A0A3M9MEE8_9MICO|nr:hypothetical protein [Flexivirga caeni]RNI23213.1 hypothetical protein EFY87_07195 [Flexivirga caeni]
MKRLALATASVLAACSLAACGGGSGSSATTTATSTAPQPNGPYLKQKPSPGDSPGVVVANKQGRKVVLDKSLPVYDPPVQDGAVPQADWPVAGRLLSIKELLGVFPDAIQIAFNPEGPTKLVVTPQLPGDSDPKKYPNTISITINKVGTESSILAAYDSSRASDRTVQTQSSGKPSSGYIYYDDGAFGTQRLRMTPAPFSSSNDSLTSTYLVVIGNGRTAMQLTVSFGGFFSLDPSGFGSDKIMQQQVMPLIFQLLAARM